MIFPIVLVELRRVPRQWMAKWTISMPRLPIDTRSPVVATKPEFWNFMQQSPQTNVTAIAAVFGIQLRLWWKHSLIKNGSSHSFIRIGPLIWICANPYKIIISNNNQPSLFLESDFLYWTALIDVCEEFSNHPAPQDRHQQVQHSTDKRGLATPRPSSNIAQDNFNDGWKRETWRRIVDKWQGFCKLTAVRSNSTAKSFNLEKNTWDFRIVKRIVHLSSEEGHSCFRIRHISTPWYQYRGQDRQKRCDS